jgi:hypothetical protein
MFFFTNFPYLSWMISVSPFWPSLVTLTYISNSLVECTNCEASHNNCFGPSVIFLVVMFFYGCGRKNSSSSCNAFPLNLSSVHYIYIKNKSLCPADWSFGDVFLLTGEPKSALQIFAFEALVRYTSVNLFLGMFAIFRKAILVSS